MVSDEILKLWSNHPHAMVKEIVGREYHHHVVEYCPTCHLFAKHSGIPENLHHTHPAGCRCMMCADCRCKEVVERDEKADAERKRKYRIATLQEELKHYRTSVAVNRIEVEKRERELMGLTAEPKG